MKKIVDELRKLVRALYGSHARKFQLALLAALGVLSDCLADGSLSPADDIKIALAFAGALGVYGVTNGVTNTNSPAGP